MACAGIHCGSGIHLCRPGQDVEAECEYEDAIADEVYHVDQFRVISAEKASAKQKEWNEMKGKKIEDK